MTTIDLSRGGRLLTIRYEGHITANEVRQDLEQLAHLLEGTSPGFVLLTDLSGLRDMDPDCAEALGEVMELCDRRGVAGAVRIIPDPQKDIGFALISRFHQLRRVHALTFETMAEALATLKP